MSNAENYALFAGQLEFGIKAIRIMHRGGMDAIEKGLLTAMRCYNQMQLGDAVDESCPYEQEFTTIEDKDAHRRGV